VTYQVVWSLPALDRAAGFLRDDADGVAAVMDAVDELADDPYPDSSVGLGSDDLRRMHVGRYRVMFEIEDEPAIVTVVHLGRLG
jgi:mRNA interferase RelE/StbE